MQQQGLGRSLALGVAALGAFTTLANLSMPVVDRRPSVLVTVLVAALLLAHAALYWNGERVRSRLSLGGYVAAQAAVVFLVGLTDTLVPVVLAIYVALTVETVIVAGPKWGTMPITVGAIALFGAGAIITSDLYRGATAGLLLAVTGVLAHAVAALVRRGDPAPRSTLPVSPIDVAVAVSSPPNVVDYDRRELAGLTAREREVLQALTHGSRTSEIAERLDISERTVKAHLANIYQKLGVESRTAAVAVALQRGPG
jgi:DNA-binding CsgD family transcriptional regulator